MVQSPCRRAAGRQAGERPANPRCSHEIRMGVREQVPALPHAHNSSRVDRRGEGAASVPVAVQLVGCGESSAGSD